MEFVTEPGPQGRLNCFVVHQERPSSKEIGARHLKGTVKHRNGDLEHRMDDQQTPTSSSIEDSPEQGPKRTNKKQTPPSAYVVLCIFLIGSFLTAYAFMNDIWMFSNEFKPGPVIALEVSDLELGQDMVGQVVEGTVRNDTGENYRDVQVEVNLYDADGNLLGTDAHRTEVLAVGQTWEFVISILFDSVARVEVKEVTGFLSDD
ncbi:MAG: hypothetical protein IH945_06300 [Armatimonadetes bacterium]|nr:hypothetical protein [Armatimonadota bacterium]